ncbi:TPA: DNA end protector protein, partial [Escherichia coli]|nr:DNA end protector protein [Escherichia coli]
RPQPGRIYAFAYDAKHKETLPYWDKFPLIIYLGLGKHNLMYGLNLHYIPPKARQQFLEELLKQYANTPTITNKTKLKIDWSQVKGFRGADQMIKAYIPGNIMGSLVEIAPKDWANVVLMPLQSFYSKGKRFSANKVWSNVR